MLNIPPSFLLTPTFPFLFTAVTALVDHLPYVPAPALTSELPFAFLDALTRAFLLCTLIPPSITTHSLTSVAQNPWTLLVASFGIANGGFFLVNLLSFLHPTGLALQTPAELKPWGWTTVDLWAAPVFTGLYATLTHAQPVWADLHGVLVEFLGGSTTYVDFSTGKEIAGVKPLDPESARAVCAVLLAGLFVGRTVRTALALNKLEVQRKGASSFVLPPFSSDAIFPRSENEGSMNATTHEHLGYNLCLDV